MARTSKPKMKDYTKRAQDNYRAKIDQVNLILPKGCKDYMLEHLDTSVNAYIRELVLKDLKERFGYEPEQ